MMPPPCEQEADTPFLVGQSGKGQDGDQKESVAGLTVFSGDRRAQKKPRRLSTRTFFVSGNIFLRGSTLHPAEAVPHRGSTPDPAGGNDFPQTPSLWGSERA